MTARICLAVDNSDCSLIETAHALWREGRDPLAIAGALLECSKALTGDWCVSAVIEILAQLTPRDEARSITAQALLRCAEMRGLP